MSGYTRTLLLKNGASYETIAVLNGAVPYSLAGSRA
jgi:hypothetical protein